MKSIPIKRSANAWRKLWLMSSTVLVGVCVAGSAVAAEAESPSTDAPAEASVEPPAAVEAPRSAHHGSVFVDPLGFLLFGPTFGVEAGSGRISGTLYGRWLNPGASAHSLFLKDKESFAFSSGVGLRGRYFLHDDLSGPHVGVGAELVQTRVDDSVNLIETKTTYVVPLLEGGYRLAFSGLYVGAAAAFGYAFKASGSVGNLPGGSTADAFSASNKSTVYGSASLELGAYF
jgi:hypothetical protein